MKMGNFKSLIYRNQSDIPRLVTWELVSECLGHENLKSYIRSLLLAHDYSVLFAVYTSLFVGRLCLQTVSPWALGLASPPPI